MAPPPPNGHLALDRQVRQNAERRLRSIKGHIEGVLRMLEQDAVYCVDILKQLKAIDGALNKVSLLVLRSHLQDHVVTARERGDVHHIVDEMMEVLKYR